MERSPERNEPSELEWEPHIEEERNFDIIDFFNADQRVPVVTGAITPNADLRFAKPAQDPALLEAGNKAIARWWMSQRTN
jgi:hypothetical protein